MVKISLKIIQLNQLMKLTKNIIQPNLKRMRQFYWIIEKGAPLGHQLIWSHYKILIPLKNIEMIKYYIDKCEKNNLSKRELNPIFIKNKHNLENINEKIIKQLILEDIEIFMKELGNGYCFIGSEYKIKIGNKFNYIDLLLYNIEFNCYVVIELKVLELKKEHIGQIQVYMNYINDNAKNVNQNKTIGIIIVRKNNQFVLEYCSDRRIFSREYKLI